MPWLIGVILKSSIKNTPGILVLDLESHAVLSAVLQLQLTLHHLVKVVRTFKVEANCRILSWTKHIIQVRKLWVLTQGSHRLLITVLILLLLFYCKPHTRKYGRSYVSKKKHGIRDPVANLSGRKNENKIFSFNKPDGFVKKVKFTLSRLPVWIHYETI